MSDKEITKWCEHGNTNHVYCADCVVSSQQQLIESQAKEIEKLKMIHEDYRRTALERIAYQESEMEKLREIQRALVLTSFNANNPSEGS